MNVSLQNIDKVSAVLTVKLEKADYQEKVDKALKSFRQKAQIPGFRKGMVPMSLLKKCMVNHDGRGCEQVACKKLYIIISRTIR